MHRNYAVIFILVKHIYIYICSVDTVYTVHKKSTSKLNYVTRYFTI